ncbi:Retrovirus-related Pol polyprotein from transposon TNT 1-94 [Glycine soja]
MTLEEGKVKIEKFDSRDFSFWKMQIEDYLYQKKFVIKLTLAKNVAFNIINEKTTTSLMKTLSDMYEKPSATNKVYLMRRLFNLKIGEGISVTDHINEFNTILAQLESIQIKFEDEVKALILLSSLPDISSSTRENTLKLNDIRDLILSEDVCKRDSGKSSSHVSNSALNIEGRRMTAQNGRGRSKSRGKGQTKFRSDIICWNCDKRVQSTKEEQDSQNKKRDNDESANASTDEFDDALICSLYSPIDSWIMDSDGKSLDIIGRGDIDIKTSSGSLWTLHKVRHILALKRNLISIGQLDDEGHYTTFGDGAWKDMVAVTEAVNNSTLWHQRLGHMSEKGMKLMAAKGKLSSLKHVDVGVYQHCIFGKQKKVSFSRVGKTPKVEKLELVH